MTSSSAVEPHTAYFKNVSISSGIQGLPDFKNYFGPDPVPLAILLIFWFCSGPRFHVFFWFWYGPDYASFLVSQFFVGRGPTDFGLWIHVFNKKMQKDRCEDDY